MDRRRPRRQRRFNEHWPVTLRSPLPARTPAVHAAALLLASCVAASAQVAPLPSALCAGWQGEPVCERLHEDAQVRILRCTFPPGIGHEPHYHPPHFGYLLGEGGAMRITSAAGVQDRVLEAGSFFSNDSEVRHEVLNIGQTTVRYLIVEKKYADTRAQEAIAPGLCAAG